MNAVTVERQRGEAKKKNGIGDELATPLRGSGRGLALRRRIAGLCCLTIDDVLLLGDREVVRGIDAVAYGHEHERSRFAVLGLDRNDFGIAAKRIAHAQRLPELDAPTGPHPPRKAHRWKKA